MAYRVLVVDDDPFFLEMMRSLLAGEGYDVDLCSRSDRAHYLALARRPDAITLDLRMPGPSGWEVLQSLKSDPEIAPVPMLVISAAGAELAATTERLNALGYPRVQTIAKPFEVDELLSRIAEAALAYRDSTDA